MSDPAVHADVRLGTTTAACTTNSGVPNHAYALMVDGGTYNGRTITGIGLTKAAKIEYRALTQYLTSGSDFLDNYNALQAVVRRSDRRQPASRAPTARR